MPIPETPYTRKEAYLNAIATGDSGGIPETPYTREEMYLDAIARNAGGGGGGGGSSTLSGLTDVDISNPSDGQTLVYNSTSGKWENGDVGGNVLVIHNDYTTYTLDKTADEIYEAYAAGQPCMIVETETAENPDSEERYEWYRILIYATKSEFDYPPDPTTYSYEFSTKDKSWTANSPSDYPSAAY